MQKVGEQHPSEMNVPSANPSHNSVQTVSRAAVVVVSGSVVVMLGSKGCVQKKIAEKETLVHMGGRGVKIIPFF